MPTLKKKRQQRVASSQRKEKTKGEKTKSRSVVYSEITSFVHMKGSSEGPITVDLAKELLGWEEEEDKKPLGNKHVAEVSRAYGKKVRCNNNVSNRPIYQQVLNTLKQEFLRGRWRFNGEPIIIGKTGLILNGQHTLIALILAAKEQAEHPDKWPLCPEEPVLEKLIVFGVDEDDEVVNTMDTCKPRSLADVIYRAAYFKDLPAKGQRVAAKMTQYAIKKMWERTGVHINNYATATRRTHAESVSFLDKHPKLLEAIRHIYEEDDAEGRISKYLTPGYSAAALYLMACCNTEPETYYGAEDPSEQVLDLGMWDLACEFFVELAAGAQGLKPLRDQVIELDSQGSTGWKERWALIAAAWVPYSQGKPVTAKDVKLEFVFHNDERQLAEDPIFGGIDVGEEGLHFLANGDPDKEEIENGVEVVQEKKTGRKRKVASRAGEQWAKGDKAWVHPSDGEQAFFATLTGDPFQTHNGPDKVFVDAEDGEWEVNVSELSLAQFEMKG